MKMIRHTFLAVLAFWSTSVIATEYRDPFDNIRVHMEWDRDNETFPSYIARLNYLAFAEVPKPELKKLLKHVLRVAELETASIEDNNTHAPDMITYLSPLQYALSIFHDTVEEHTCSDIAAHLSLGYRAGEREWSDLPGPIHDIMPLLVAYCRMSDK